VAVSPARPERVWAIIEADDGGLYRSDDAGRTWQRVNDDRNMRQRAWYYTHVVADPKNPDAVYVLNVRFLRSGDGGRTFQPLGEPHGDNHDLWIDPDDSARMIESNDGGVNVSFDGGRSWTQQDNQPTAQFYHARRDSESAAPTGTTSAAARAGSSRPSRASRRSSMPAPTMVCSPVSTAARIRPAT
jgi:photosystem II stability/assembly factor-like uncharacterized protein